MRLFSGKIPVISAEITRDFIEGGDIETSNKDEVEEDVASVLKEYLRTDRELTERAKDLLEIRDLPYSKLGRLKKGLADERGFGTGEDALDYIMQQVIEILMHSFHVEEVYSEDHDLRRKMKPVLRKHMAVDEEVEEEVRRKIKNLDEGTQAWDVEYSRVKEQIIRRRGLSE